ncbi:ABC transporter ATP-binding protein [Halobaculum magnesiiphilum]|uniref:Probable branched-chain amino acid transport ATP-binding protein LivG n=1 Tax=Halobaculum magnesiiphilum TaxID=1017351 RepID=A0A8T8WEN5_9EURY|nr:ABC transporter ATP-binding protein [Halobaculum magnesiiphilum]QZP38203.1 ABC transporter ATP-binding protein [Halobaculum magnesiiphilum]
MSAEDASGRPDADATGGEADDSADPDPSQATAQGARDADEHPLVVENLRKTFGGITAVDDASFSVAEGSLTGLIGPNGAGKSTTFNCITGVHTPSAGRVTFRGDDITGMAPHTIAQQGLVRTFQIARELPEMTVLENMMLAPKRQVGERLTNAVVPGLRGRVVEQEEELLERAWQQLEFFEIDHLAQEYAGTLSGGQRKLLEMARALMTDPEMVLLDEPLAGVNPTLEEKLLDRIHKLRDRGNTFLFVEHDMDVIMNNCEHVIVMHQGSVLAEGTPEQVTNDERVVEAYLGGDV